MKKRRLFVEVFLLYICCTDGEALWFMIMGGVNEIDLAWEKKRRSRTRTGISIKLVKMSKFLKMKQMRHSACSNLILIRSVERLQFNSPTAAHSHQAMWKRISRSVDDVFLCVLRGAYVKEHHPRVLFSWSNEPLIAQPKPLNWNTVHAQIMA